MDSFEVASVVKRRYPRRPFAKKVGVLCGGIYHLGRANELGEGGIGFLTDIDIASGLQVVVSFQMPDGKFISLKALVKSTTKRAGGFLVGCAFNDLSFTLRRQIRTFVSEK